jgi:hypothetical protein
MILSTAQYSVSATPVRIVASNEVGRHVYINCTTNSDFYIGPSNTVSTTTGFFVAKTAADLMIQMDANDELWAVMPSGTHTVSVLQVTL